jgi:hypothetical protein
MTICSGFQVILRVQPQQFEKLHCWYYGRQGFVKYAIKMVSSGTVYIPVFVKSNRGVQAILRVLSQQSERLLCWYHVWEGYRKYSIEMASGGMIYIRRFMKIGSGLQAILRLCLNNLRGCNVGITDGWDLCITILDTGSGATKYIPSFIWIGSCVQKLLGRMTHTHTQTAM